MFPDLRISKAVIDTISGSYTLELEGSWQASELTTLFTDEKIEA